MKEKWCHFSFRRAPLLKNEQKFIFTIFWISFFCHASGLLKCMLYSMIHDERLVDQMTDAPLWRSPPNDLPFCD